MTSPGGAASRETASDPVLDAMRAQILDAGGRRAPLRITGGDTKAFYGRRSEGATLAVSAYAGVVAFEPTELVLTARAGTPLAEVEALLDGGGQMLGFEPPRFGTGGTIGGAIATGLSGPRRPFAGAVRDFVLGVRIMNGNADILKFGGRVMKNVAGYDVSRLMVGALGTFGALLEVSVALVPKPEAERSLSWECDAMRARELMIDIQRHPWPVSGLSFDGRIARARLSGHAQAVEHACRALSADAIGEDADYWRSLRDQRLPFFEESGPLWRLCVPHACGPLALSGRWYWDWGGAQRWLRSDEPAARIRDIAQAAGGHATLFRGGAGDVDPFMPLSAAALSLHRRLKEAFDPAGLFNRGRMYPGL